MHADIKALDGTKLAKQNVDVASILTTVLGALPDVRRLKAPCAERFPLSDNTNFDKLEVDAPSLHLNVRANHRLQWQRRDAGHDRT